MKSLRVFFLICFLIPTFLTDAPSLLAQTRAMTLDQCLTLGLANNVDVQRGKNDVERARGSRLQAFGQFLPDLTASGSWSRSDQDVIYFRGQVPYTSRNSFSYSVGSNLTLFDGLGNIYTADRSILAHKSAELSFARKRQDIIFSIQAQFFNVLRLKQLILVNQRNVERSQKQLVRVRELHAVGSSPQADVYRQEVQAGRDELGLIQAEGNYRDALLDLQTLIGLRPEESFEIDDAGIPTGVTATEIRSYRQELGDFSGLVRKAMENRLDYQSAKLQLEGQKKAVSVAQASYFPNVSAFARYSWSNLELKEFSEYDRFTYGLSVNVPIFNNFSTRASVERAQYDAIDAENVNMQLERQVAADVRKALNALATAEKNVEIASRTLASAREDQRIATERYGLGAGTLLDVIVGAANQAAAEADMINANFSYITAQKQLDYTLGN